MHIYLIDNDLIVLKTLQRFLNDLGHDVVPINSISGLLKKKIQMNGNVDVIIVDLKMPKPDGIRMIRAIHHKYPNSDIIVMSSVLPFQEAISHGVHGYLKKPIYLDELELILARVTKKQHGIKKVFHKQTDVKD